MHLEQNIPAKHADLNNRDNCQDCQHRGKRLCKNARNRRCIDDVQPPDNRDNRDDKRGLQELYPEGSPGLSQ